MIAPREYIGQLGGLVPVRASSSLTVARESRYQEFLTVEGVRRVFMASRPQPRSWDVDFPYLDFAAADTMEAFALGLFGTGPFVWVPSDAQIGSVLTPAQSALRSLGAEFAQAGPVTVDGVSLPVSASVSIPSGWRGLVDVPVVPGMPVTASVWVQSATGAPIITTGWVVGGGIPETQSVTGSSGGMWQRLSWTGVAPAGASQLRLGVRSSVTAVAGPQVTWTRNAMPYAAGRSSTSVVVESVGITPSLISRTAHGRELLADVKMRVLEVGDAGW